MTTYDRELKGPDTYEYFNNISKICQVNYINLLKAQLFLLLLIAIISIFPIANDKYENYKQSLNIILMSIVLILMILQFAKNYMSGWQKARFLSESILSNCWLLIFKCDSYSEDNYDNSLAKFQERIKEMKKEINIKDYLSFSALVIKDHDNPPWMKEKYSATLNDKKEFYIKYRIGNQISWYGKKAKYNKNNSTKYFVYGLIALTVGLVLTVLVLIKVIPNLSYLGLFTTLAASLFSWKQTKRFDELKTTYSVAADELRDFGNVLQRKKTESDIQETVFDTEKSISREHKLWFSKVLD